MVKMSNKFMRMDDCGGQKVKETRIIEFQVQSEKKIKYLADKSFVFTDLF